MSDDTLLFELRGRTAWLTLNRPDAMNALTLDMYERLAKHCEAIEAGGEVRCMVIAGAGERAFAAGTDINVFRQVRDEAAVLAYEALMDRVFGAIERCPVPVIAAMAGAATGGGAAIACAADIRIATADLRFGFPIARTLGNALSIANLSRLCALVGEGRARDMLLTSELMNAESALAAGLVSRLCPDREALMGEAQRLAERIETLSPVTLAATKDALLRLRMEGSGAQDRDLILRAYMSEDFREAVEAFFEKRRPAFKGR